jgi:hypothetical protein
MASMARRIEHFIEKPGNTRKDLFFFSQIIQGRKIEF